MWSVIEEWAEWLRCCKAEVIQGTYTKELKRNEGRRRRARGTVCRGQHDNPSTWGVEAGLWVQVQLGPHGKTFFKKRREIKVLCTSLRFHIPRRFSYVFCQQKSGTKRESSWPGNIDSGSPNATLRHDICSMKFDNNRTKKAMNQDTLNTFVES